MKPIVLLIENAIDVTGSVKSAMRSCRYLREDFEFQFILPKHSLAKSYVEKEGFVIHEIPFLEISKSWMTLIFYFPVLFFNVFRLKKIILSSGAKLIITNDFYNLVPALYKLQGGRVPYVTFVRFIPSRFPGILVSSWCFLHYRFAAKIVAVSSVVLKELRPNAKVILVYNELPVEKDFKFYSYDASSRTILYLSNYIPGKGLEYAIEAFASLKNDFADWTLRFVGSDMGLKKNKAYKKILQTLAEDLQVSHRITWHNFAEDVVDEYKRASLVLNFSDSESFSLTCLEAMYVGRPVIATRSGGPEEIITEGFDGELVGVRNIKQMTSALKKLLSDAGLRERYGGRAYLSTTIKFSFENTAFKLNNIYKEAILSGR